MQMILKEILIRILNTIKIVAKLADKEFARYKNSENMQNHFDQVF
jgi:two-component sensor histidine kinase